MTQPIERRVVLPVEPDDARDESPMPADEGLARISRLADDLLPTLITRVDASSLGELEVRRNGWRIRLRRGPVNGAEHRSGVSHVASGPERERDGAASETPAAAHDRGSRHEVDEGLVTAPAVGYFQPREGISAGMNMRGGDLLGRIDVLGVEVDVAVPADGRLVRMLAEPGEAVEFGQPLARLEAESRA